MKSKFLSLTLLAVSIFSVSCSSDDSAQDTTKPEVLIVEPHDHDAFEAGGMIHVEVNFSDNQALASYKVDIHFDDGHDHGVRSTEVEWEYSEEGTMSGKNYTLHSEIQIPELINEMPIAHGDYHLGIYCLDEAGNETVVFRTIEIGEHGDDHGDH